MSREIAEQRHAGFDTGPQFVFNIGGNRGFRVHQFGGAGPRRRPREAARGGQPRREASGWDTLLALLPILFLFLFPLLTSLLSGLGGLGGDHQGAPAVPKMAFDHPAPPLTLRRTTEKLGVSYFVNPAAVDGWTDGQLGRLDRDAELTLGRELRRACAAEQHTKQRLLDDAQGWFFPDQDKLRVAKEYQMINCQRLDKLGISR